MTSTNSYKFQDNIRYSSQPVVAQTHKKNTHLENQIINNSGNINDQPRQLDFNINLRNNTNEVGDDEDAQFLENNIIILPPYESATQNLRSNNVDDSSIFCCFNQFHFLSLNSEINDEFISQQKSNSRQAPSPMQNIDEDFRHMYITDRNRQIMQNHYNSDDFKWKLLRNLNIACILWFFMTLVMGIISPSHDTNQVLTYFIPDSLLALANIYMTIVIYDNIERLQKYFTKLNIFFINAGFYNNQYVLINQNDADKNVASEGSFIEKSIRQFHEIMRFKISATFHAISYKLYSDYLQNTINQLVKENHDFHSQRNTNINSNLNK